MKKCIGIWVLFFWFNYSHAQIVSGVVKYSNTGQAVIGSNIVCNFPLNAVSTDINGRFVVTVQSEASLSIRFIGMKEHVIRNIPNETDTINLGSVFVIDTGGQGFALVQRTRVLTRKKYYRCERFDTRKEITYEDLAIRSNTGSLLYTWQFEKELDVFWIDYSELKSKLQ